MEYSNLVEAIRGRDRATTNQLLQKMTPRLIRYLQIHMNAGVQDAEDCVQQALLDGVQSIREQKIRDADRILSFFLTACRNNYLNLINKKRDQTHGNIDGEYSRGPRQLLAMMDKERHRLLEWCLDQLSEGYKSFIDYWFSYPDSSSEAASTHFGITVSNVWTRKHRVIKKLSECCSRKGKI